MHHVVGGQMAERLGNRAINQMVVGLFHGRAKCRCVLGQGTSPYLPRGTYSKSLWIRASAKCKCNVPSYSPNTASLI